MVREDRRKFLQLMLAAGVYGVLPHRDAHAFLPFLARLLVSSAVRLGIGSAERSAAGYVGRAAVGAAGRSAISTAGRTAVGSAGRVAAGASAGALVRAEATTTARGRSWALIETSLFGSVVAIEPSLALTAQKSGASAIWVIDDPNVNNHCELEITSQAPERKMLQVGVTLIDKKSGVQELAIPSGVLAINPGDVFSYSFRLSELPYEGIKHVIGVGEYVHSNAVTLLAVRRENVLYQGELES